MNQIQLFCLPYAGGSADAYRKWKRYYDKSIVLYPVELSGRGRRSDEPFYNTLAEAIADVHQIIKRESGQAPYALFGHSMGSIIAYELYFRMKEMGDPLPIHLFFSGRGAPNKKRDKKIIHQLPDAELIGELRGLGGTPPELLSDLKSLSHFLPVIRADFKIVETYRFIDKPDKIDCNITVFNGTNDDVGFDELIEWRNHTHHECKFYNFPGGHFFINDYISEISKIVNGVLSAKSHVVTI